MPSSTATLTMATPKFAPIKAESLPAVQAFPVTASPQEIIAALKITGGCVIKNAVSKDVVSQIEKVTFHTYGIVREW
jgi:hypothetical protein